MTSNEAVVAMIEVLERAGIPYMLVGSYSSNAYGVARATQDADFVLQALPDGLQRIVAELPPGFSVDRQLIFEGVTTTNRHLVHAPKTQFKIELFYLSNDPHDAARFARRALRPYLGRSVYLPTPEDVIITKLRWCSRALRSKDADDVRQVIAAQSEALDWAYIHQWCDQHGTRALLDELRRSIPPA